MRGTNCTDQQVSQARRACVRVNGAKCRKERKQSLALVETLEKSRYAKGCVICGRLLFGGGKRMANM